MKETQQDFNLVTLGGYPNREPLSPTHPYLPTGPLDTQVGGDHYKSMPIQPIEFAVKNGLNACQAKAIKYIVRNKGDTEKRIEDLEKAIHAVELYIGFLKDGTLTH